MAEPAATALTATTAGERSRRPGFGPRAAVTAAEPRGAPCAPRGGGGVGGPGQAGGGEAGEGGEPGRQRSGPPLTAARRGDV